MVSSRKLRRFAPWLLGLFLIAHFAAIVPLLITDLQHDIETVNDIGDDLAATGTLEHVHAHHKHENGQHDHTSVDVNDQCCTIHHHLAGILLFAISATPEDFPAIASPAASSRRLPGTEPGGVERPPRLPVSI